MENRITVREAVTDNDAALFWAQLHSYFKRDMFPDPAAEEREDFLGDTYRAMIQQLHDRPQDRCRWLFFQRDGQDIGFAMPVIYTSEDGKCFVMEFCVYPEYRGNGAGRECAGALLRWAEENGAHYAELTYGGDERRLRFWKSVGFVENGTDDWGEPLLLLPPGEEVPITVEVLTDPDDWQLLKLQNGLRRESGESALTEAERERLQQTVREGKATFFVAKRGCRAVGMCSVANGETAVCGGLYVEPAFRGKGIAEKLMQAARVWNGERGKA